MARHLNNQIAQIGHDTVSEWFALEDNLYMVSEAGELTLVHVPVDSKGVPMHDPNEKELEKGYLEQTFADKLCLLHISTKKHDLRQGEKVTGLNVTTVQSLQAKALAAGLEDVFVVFVDARLKIVMGGFLSQMMKPFVWSGISWPIAAKTHQGEVYYFSVHLIRTLFKLTDATVEQIGHLSAQNKVDKNQGYLFE